LQLQKIKMTDTTARLRSGKLVFETMVDLDSAMKFKRGEQVDINEVIKDTKIYNDLKKGRVAGGDELMNVFGTTNFSEIVSQIIKKGQIEATQEFRNEALDVKKKQIVDFIVRNAVDVRTNRPFTPEMIESSLKEAGVRIDNQPVEKQMNTVMEGLKRIVPIKIETKKVKIRVPAEHTGKVYGLLQEYKEKEEWLGNGSLEVILNIPVGIQMDFYDKLNSVTHGSTITEEMKEE